MKNNENNLLIHFIYSSFVLLLLLLCISFVSLSKHIKRKSWKAWMRTPFYVYRTIDIMRRIEMEQGLKGE